MGEKEAFTLRCSCSSRTEGQVTRECFKNSIIMIFGALGAQRNSFHQSPQVRNASLQKLQLRPVVSFLQGSQTTLGGLFPGASTGEDQRALRAPGLEQTRKGGGWKAKCSYQHLAQVGMGRAAPLSGCRPCLLLARCPFSRPLPLYEAGLTWGPERPQLEPGGYRALSHQPGRCHRLLGRVMTVEPRVWPQNGVRGRAASPAFLYFDLSK